MRPMDYNDGNDSGRQNLLHRIEVGPDNDACFLNNDCRQSLLSRQIEIIDKHAKSFLDMLLNDMLNDEIGFTTSGRTHYEQGTKRIDNIDPTFSKFSLQIIPGGQVN